MIYTSIVFSLLASSSGHTRHGMTTACGKTAGRFDYNETYAGFVDLIWKLRLPL